MSKRASAYKQIAPTEQMGTLAEFVDTLVLIGNRMGKGKASAIHKEPLTLPDAPAKHLSRIGLMLDYIAGIRGRFKPTDASDLLQLSLEASCTRSALKVLNELAPNNYWVAELLYASIILARSLPIKEFDILYAVSMLRRTMIVPGVGTGEAIFRQKKDYTDRQFEALQKSGVYLDDGQLNKIFRSLDSLLAPGSH
jgi:hypothetical protein